MLGDTGSVQPLRTAGVHHHTRRSLRGHQDHHGIGWAPSAWNDPEVHRSHARPKAQGSRANQLIDFSRPQLQFNIYVNGKIAKHPRTMFWGALVRISIFKSHCGPLINLCQQFPWKFFGRLIIARHLYSKGDDPIS